WCVLDAGAGTGLIALLAAPRVTKSGAVIGVDASEQMLAHARARAAQFGFSQCAFRAGDLHALDFSANHFNAILSQFALHYTEPAKALAEFYRVLAPGGMLALHIWALDSSAPHTKMYQVLPPYRANTETEMLAHLRAQAARSYLFRQTFGTSAQIQDALASAGFVNVEARAEAHPTRVANTDAFLELAHASPLLRAEILAMPEISRGEFLRAARAELRAFESLNGFAWTFHVIAVTAHKV
ncbi:MAG: methyltransferase domain-containing protein, partial [Chloroflexi bacterium]|nr:methyltransferase domain-containing protein [Chloroflexota bacterium]